MRFITDRKPGVRVPKVRVSETERDEVVRLASGQIELVLGAGKPSEMTRRKLLLLFRRIIRIAKERSLSELSCDLEAFDYPKLKLSVEEKAELFAAHALLADFSFTRFKTPPTGGFPHIERIWLWPSPRNADLRRGLRRGTVIGTEMNRAREISTLPGGEMTPALLAQHAKSAMRGLPVRVRVLGPREMERLGLRGILAVGKGSRATPRFILLEYRGAARADAPVVMVGKGVTFDSGGINLKPSDSILGMNMDMSGGAAVIHVLAACVRLKYKRNLVALVPAAENMPSGSSYRPGDIVRSLSGQTIEVQNTDAEGRILLADALTYAKRYHPALVIDVATLTGAVMMALGERAAGLFTADERLENTLRHIGAAVGDPVWPLPLWDEYLEDIRGTYGDLGNVGSTKWGGAVTAAVFLKQFTKDFPWVHLDIGSRMTSPKGEELAPGALGSAIYLLVRFLAGQR